MMNPSGIPLPPDLAGGPVVIGVDDATTCGRPLRAAVFLARALCRPILLVHVRRRSMPMVEGYVPIPEEMAVDDVAEDAIESALRTMLISGGELEGVDWELISVTGETASEIIRIAQDREAACVVVGKRHKGFAEFVHRITSGSVSRAVVATQKFPVLVVP
ncbi:nucleotide-binding universal stress UspA family protein [Nakamurella sp. UYEF19]|uniref:universal stress protein n=1 Tax=Nakamurella sp. UYEF19 TaxID=1756392 RepID=UPI00339678E0